MSARILAIVGSYRANGIVERLVEEALAACRERGLETERIDLRERHLEFCSNCRACCQQPGEQRGLCPIDDDLDAILERVEAAEGLILASPTNFYGITALFKRFLERLVGVAFWPWGAKTGPRMRRKHLRKRALLLSACAAPGFLGRLVFSTHRQLGLCAWALGAKVVGRQMTGLIAQQAIEDLPPAALRRARRGGAKLAAAVLQLAKRQAS
jgi:putative NADPH-quinone reductase